MAKEAIFQVRMDSDLKRDVEALYKELGTSFAEAVRIFAKQSLRERGMPFMVREEAFTYDATPSQTENFGELPFRGSACGSASKYADPTKWPLEEGAFERAMIEKHAGEKERMQNATPSRASLSRIPLKDGAYGALSKYADPTKWPLEQTAFEEAMVEKYGKTD